MKNSNANKKQHRRDKQERREKYQMRKIYKSNSSMLEVKQKIKQFDRVNQSVGQIEREKKNDVKLKEQQKQLCKK